MTSSPVDYLSSSTMVHKRQRRRRRQRQPSQAMLICLVCSILGGGGGGAWNNNNSRNSHNGRYYVGKVFALADITTTTTTTTTTAHPSQQQHGQRQLASFSFHNHHPRHRRRPWSSSSSTDDPPPSFWKDVDSWELLFSWNPASSLPQDPDTTTTTTTTTRTTTTITVFNTTTTTTTTTTTSSSRGLPFYEKHIDASQYVGGKNGTLVWTNENLLLFIYDDDNDNDDDDNDDDDGKEEAPAATTATEAPSTVANPDRPMEMDATTTTTTTTTIIITNNDTPQQQQQGDDDGEIILDCSRYENWESPPLPCQDKDDEEEEDTTTRPSFENPPIEAGMEDDDDDEDKEATVRNLISLRMIVGMQDPPQNMDYIQHVTSMVTNQLVQEKTPFDAFYFGMSQIKNNDDDDDDDDDDDVRRRRSMTTTTHTMITDDPSGNHERRRELESADDSSSSSSSSSSTTASTRQVHLLHAWTTMTPFDYYAILQDCGGNNNNNKTQDTRFLRSNTTTTNSQQLPSQPMIDNVVWYETHIEYAALFAYPDGTTQPIQNREYLGNITSYCQWHLDRNIENGKWVRQLDWTIYDWIYNLTTTTTTTTTTMNDTILEEMKEDLDFVAAAVMPTSSGIVLDPYWVVELRGRPRTIPTQALVLRFEWREWLGLAMGTTTLLVALLLYMASSYRQRKHHEQQWKATLTEQGIGDVLKVGWRYQVTTTAVPTASRDAGAAAATTPQDHTQIFLQVYENPKRHFRNEDESSLLQGGVEQEEMGRTTGAAFVLAPTQSMSATASQDDSSTTPRTRNGISTISSMSSSQVPSKQAKKTRNDVKSVASLPVSSSSSRRSFQDAKQIRKKKLSTKQSNKERSSNFHPPPSHARKAQCADGTSNGSSSSSLLSSGATRLSVEPSGHLHRPPHSHILYRKGRPCTSDLMSSSSTTMTAPSLPVTTKTTRKKSKSHDNKSSKRKPKGFVTKTSPPK